MSAIHRGDEHLHYSDHSHRWIAPPDVDQAIWEAGMQAHMAQHRATMGGPFNIDELVEVPKTRTPARRDQIVEMPTPRVARQRRAA
ncbi:hypothetical protein GCM10022251_57280 [Phytohabitans flavus]|uniref:Uncharacterized protein n=1 Tax=Phytohabitans flavus TaxID=1076124 RepID=A0A6F8XTM5_9ACTN|nr:hypothetical protein [Phytohabitans flavus]BCB77183.1 hypothetical protein Pflav_035930 [Phytohabitans flavus]